MKTKTASDPANKSTALTGTAGGGAALPVGSPNDKPVAEEDGGIIKAARKGRLLAFFVALAGVALILAGHYLKVAHLLEGVAQEGAELIPKFVIDLGIAFVVAALVAVIYDAALHDSAFGHPVRSLRDKVAEHSTRIEKTTEDLTLSVENKLQNLTANVGSLNLILKSAIELRINVIYERMREDQQSKFVHRVEEVIADAREFIYIMGRSLDELFERPHDDLDPKMVNLLRLKLEQDSVKDLKFVLADTYTHDSLFRKECDARLPDDSDELWRPARRTGEHLLKLKYVGERLKREARECFQIKLSEDYVPFMMVMTEKILLVQPYLPFRNGVEGIVIEIKSEGGDDARKGAKAEGLYEFYKDSYERLFKQIGEPKPVLQAYARRKRGDTQATKKIADLLAALDINDHLL